MTEKTISDREFRNMAGTELGPSDWILIDQERINQFADAIGDHNFIHVDAKKAAETPFGSTIAHGLLTQSLVSRLVYEMMPKPENFGMSINYGSDKVRFLQPVKVDSRIRVRARIENISARPGGQYLTKSTVTIEIENEDRPALIAEFLFLYFLTE